MNFSISNSKVQVEIEPNSFPLNDSDVKNLQTFFSQGTFNEKLDAVKPQSVLGLASGALDVIHQTTLKHLYTVQKTFDNLIPGSFEDAQQDSTSLKNFFETQLNNPVFKQGVETIRDHYELFEQNFSEFGDRLYKHLTQAKETFDYDGPNQLLYSDIANTAKGLIDNIALLATSTQNPDFTSSFKQLVDNQQIRFNELGKPTPEFKVETQLTNDVKPNFNFE